MIRAIVFDIWATLAYMKDFTSDSAFYNHIRSEDMEEKEKELMTTCFPDTDSFIAAMIDHFAIEEPEEFGRAVKQTLGNPSTVCLYADVKEVLTKLRKKYRIGLVSNTYSIGYEGLKRTGLFELADARCLSHEEGLLKPDPKFFYTILKRLGVKANESVMVGDNIYDDIQGAEKVGMKAILIKRGEGETKHRVENGTHEYTIENLHELGPILEKIQ